MLVYLFGDCVIGIDGDEDILKRVPSRWAIYGCKNLRQPSVVVSIHQATLENTPISGTGWIPISTGQNSRVIYSWEGQPLFALEYEFPCKNVRVCLERITDRSISLGIQFAMMLALAQRCVGLHGVTIICKNQAVILSAPSGTGKTTLANLLHKFCEAAIVNGDFALLSSSLEYGLVFEPTPFCGSSKICHNFRLPISSIVFLEQARETVAERLSTREAVIRLMSNMFIPPWDDYLQHAVEDLALRIIDAVPMYRFAFLPTEDAAHLFFDEVIM